MLKNCTSGFANLRGILMLVCLAMSSISFGQPPNDLPCNATPLMWDLFCSMPSNGTTSAATLSPEALPSCGNPSLVTDVWYSFTMPDNGYHVTLSLSSSSLSEMGMAAYVGADCSSLSELHCIAVGGALSPLTVEDGCNFEYAGAQIWVRLWEIGGDNSGAFDICAQAHSPVQSPSLGTCGGNKPAADDCCDAVIFSDELVGWCGNSENFTISNSTLDGLGNWQIQPSGEFCANVDNNGFIAFVADETTIDLEVEFSSCLFGNGLQGAIFETNDCNSFNMVSTACWNPVQPSPNPVGNLSATGLTIGNVYYLMIDGWGGDRCDYSINSATGIQTTSISNSDYTICSGNDVQLELELLGVGPYNFSWTPATGLDNPSAQQPLASPTATTVYTVHITGAIDTMIDVNVNVISNVPAGLDITGTTLLCENTTGAIYYATGTEVDSFAWSVAPLGTIVGPANLDSVIINWGAYGPSQITLEAFNECGQNSDILIVNTVPAPDISATDPAPMCAPSSFDLSSISINNSAPAGGPTTFYTDGDDAFNNLNQLTSFTVTTGGQYWIRMQTAPGCFDTTSVNIQIEAPAITVTSPPAFCETTTYDLNNINIVESSGASPLDNITFFNDSLDAVNQTSMITNTVVNTSGTYWVRYETDAGCVDIAAVPVTVYLNPDITFTSPLDFCTGSSVDLDTLVFDDANATTISSKLFFTSFALAQFGQATLSMSNTVVTTVGPFYMVTLTDNGCKLITEITLTENDLPTGNVSANSSACYNESIDLNFNLTGDGPFDVVYNNGTSDVSLTGISDGHIENITLTADATFTLVSVTSTITGCSNTGGPAVAVSVNPEVTAVISGDATICAGNSTNLNFVLTGSGPFVLTYSDGTTSSIENINTSPHTVAVSPTADAVYTIVSVTDNLNCSGAVSGSATIDVGQQITVSQFLETCNVLLDGYTITFDISGGDPANYQVTGLPGTLTGSSFVSDEITAGGNYNFTVSDGSSCPVVSFNGAFDCTCTADPGTMDNTLIEICFGDPAVGSDATGIVLETGFIQEYVLHDNSTNSLGNVFARSSTPTFSFVTGMSAGVTYYISSVVGPDNGIGGFDTAHPCYQVSSGTPIIFHDRAAATLSGDATICLGATTSLTVAISGGVAPFTLTYNSPTGPVTLNNVVNGQTIDVSPDWTFTYSLVSIFDQTGVGCQGSVAGSATIMVPVPPTIDNVDFVCNNTNTQFQVVFQVSGGDMGSYAFGGDAGTFDSAAGIFTSDFINTGGTYAFSVDDMYGCGPTDISGDHLCDCDTDAGTMSASDLELCVSGTSFFTSLTPATLDADDAQAFIIHNGIGNVPFTIYAMQANSEFGFQAGMDVGTTYYVSRIVGNDDGTGRPVTDISLDPCLSISNGQPVVFFAEATISISGDLEICEGELALLQINIDEPGTYDIVYNAGLGDVNVDGVSNGQVIEIDVPSTNTVNQVSIQATDGPGCIGAVDPSNSSVFVLVNELPKASDPIISCGDPSDEYTVTFTISDGNPLMYNVVGAGTLTGNTFVSDPIPTGTAYNFEITDGTGCPAVVLSNVEHCLCTSDIAVNVNLDEAVSCFGQSDGVLTANPSNGAAPFSFFWSNGETDQTISDVAAGIYTVNMEDANGCLRETTLEVFEPTAITADLASDPTNCFGETDGLVEVVNIQGGSPTYEIEIAAFTEVGNQAAFNLPAGDYQVSIFDSNNCEFTDSITVDSAPEFNVDLGPDEQISLGDSIDLFAWTDSSLDSIAWINIPDAACPYCETQNVKPEVTTTYEVEVYSLAGCMSSAKITVFVDRQHEIYIPNAFSPNGDGSNDRFSIFAGKSVEAILNVKIFSRWGGAIYESDGQDLNNNLDGWDGKVGGKKVEAGVYLYSIEVRYLDGAVELVNGDITILK